MPDPLISYQVVCHCGRTLKPGGRPHHAGQAALCDACRGRDAEAGDLDDDVQAFIVGLETESLTEDDHPESERLVAYVKGEMDEVERLITICHVEICAMCAREMHDIQNFKEELTHVAPLTLVTEQPSLWRQPLTFWRGFSGPHFGFAAGLGVALIVVAFVSIMIRQRQESAEQTWSDQTSPVNQIGGNSALPLPMNETTPEPPVPDKRASNVTGEAPRPKPPANERRRNSFPSPHSSLPESRPIITVNNGGERVDLSDQGQITGLRGASPELRSLVAGVLESGRIETDALEGVASRPGVTLKGASEEAQFEVLSPAGTVVMTDQPLFRWRAVPNATGYTVTVVRRGQVQAATSGMISDNEWRPPAGILRPGVIYRWGVVATLASGGEMSAPGATAPEARFRVLEPVKAERIGRLTARHSRSPLSLGVLFAREGLVDDAERQFELLYRQNPRSSVANKLLQSVRGLRTRTNAERR
ncbi:MAG: hypothetical protein M3430_19665 [Acidobacteriota bacterium]|nr:hypothetical protein [Acidobacteriota bacterium]